MEEYGEILKQCVNLLPETVVVHRITGDGAKRDLIAPTWSADKKRVLNYLHRVLEGDCMPQKKCEQNMSVYEKQ